MALHFFTAIFHKKIKYETKPIDNWEEANLKLRLITNSETFYEFQFLEEKITVNRYP